MALSKPSPTEPIEGPHRRQRSPKAKEGVLAAWVAVVDDRVRAALLSGHVQGVEHELGAQMPGHRPARPRESGDPTAEPVEDDGQGHEARQGRHVEPAPMETGGSLDFGMVLPKGSGVHRKSCPTRHEPEGRT